MKRFVSPWLGASPSPSQEDCDAVESMQRELEKMA
jgi:hypothetical protein